MRLRIQLLAHVLVLLAGLTYLFLQMEWLEDRPGPLATPSEVGASHT